jgi:hypothetical protein
VFRDFLVIILAVLLVLGGTVEEEVLLRLSFCATKY